MSTVAQSRDLDTDDLSVSDIRKLADEAFEIFNSDPAYQGFGYKNEG